MVSIVIVAAIIGLWLWGRSARKSPPRHCVTGLCYPAGKRTKEKDNAIWRAVRRQQRKLIR